MTMTQQLSKPQPVKQIAKRVVNECLKVQPDEQVTVFSWDHTLDYASSVAFEVEQVGGIATTILQMNDLYWRYLKEVPEAEYARRQKGFLSLLDQRTLGSSSEDQKTRRYSRQCQMREWAR